MLYQCSPARNRTDPPGVAPNRRMRKGLRRDPGRGWGRAPPYVFAGTSATMPPMPHIFEKASSGRAKCRGCGRAIAKDELRFGERLPNPFAEGEMTLWFHPLCAAYKRPEAVLQALGEATEPVPDVAALETAERANSASRRLPRIDGAERAPSSQAKCRACKEKIEKGSWRIRLVYFEEGRFTPGGFIHLGCREAHFEGHDALAPMLHFSAGLSDEERSDLNQACGAAT